MSQPNPSDYEPLLDQIVIALREEAVPGFDNPLNQSAVARAGEVPADRRVVSAGWVRVLRTPARSFIAAGLVAATVVLIAIAFLMNSASPSNMAFGQVQQAVSRTKSIRYRLMVFRGNRDPYVITFASVRGVGMRSEGPDTVSIENPKALRSELINHRTRKVLIYQLYPFNGQPLLPTDEFQDKLRSLPARGAKQRGTAIYDGKKVLKFELEQMGEDYVVFVDPDTKLPLRMESKSAESVGGQPIRRVFTDFLFDVPVDEAIFEIRPPSGYVVERFEEPKGRKPVDTKALVVSPKGIGPIPMGAPKKKLIEFFGAPDGIQLDKSEPPDTETLHYDSLGFELRVPTDKGLQEITCFRADTSRREFLGRTDTHIRTGASIDDVLKVYGTPEIESHGTVDILNYPHKGCSFWFRERKLEHFGAAEPLSDKYEVEKLPDGGAIIRAKSGQIHSKTRKAP